MHDRDPAVAFLTAVLAGRVPVELPREGPDWDRTVELLHLHNLVGLWCSEARTLGGDDGPPYREDPRWQALEAEYLGTALHSALVVESARRARRTLTEAGIPSLTFKGAALLQDGTYPESGVRELRVRFVFGEAVAEIAVSGPEWARDVARLFPGARILDPPDGATGETEVGSTADGFYFRRGGTTTTFDSIPALMAGVEFWVVTELLELDRFCTHLHAAGAWTPGGVVLVTGPAGAGKSSRALAWSVSGLPLFGDDIVRVDSEGLVALFPRLLRVHPDRLSDFQIEPADTPFWHPDDAEAWFEAELAGGWMDRKSRTAIVAQIEYDGGG